jgi:hypothetical protein
MKRSLMFLSSFVLLSAMAFASPLTSIINRKKNQAVPESGVVPMLVLSLGAVAGGLALKRRRATKTAA